MFKQISSQPHQPFFVSGVILFIIFLLLIGANYASLITLDSSLSSLHSYPMIHIIFIQFFLGFLFVVFPKFLSQESVHVKIYMNRSFLFNVGAITYIASLFIGQRLEQIAIVLLLAASTTSFLTLFKIYKKSIVANKHDTKFILIAFGFGVLSNLLFFISTLGFTYSQQIEKLSINLGFYLFIFALIFTISQRMIPFFSSVKAQDYVINKSKYILETSFILLGLKVISLSIDNHLFSYIISFLLFGYFTYELLKWKLPVFKVTAIMWILYLSLLWIPIGFFLSLLESFTTMLNMNIVFEHSPLHAIAIGYFATILIGFGTRVTLGHSGRTPTADNITIVMFWTIQLIVLVRIFAGLSLNMELDYTFWIATSAFLLALALILWSFKYLGILIRG